MKKLLISAFALLVTAGAIAQTAEELQASKDRVAKLEKLATPPKTTGLSNIDGLATSSSGIAVQAVSISTKLQSMCAAISDASAAKPSLEEVTALGDQVKAQADAIQKAGEKVSAAAGDVKTIKNPMQIKTANTSINYSKDALALATQESAFQVKTVAALAQSLAKK